MRLLKMNELDKRYRKRAFNIVPRKKFQTGFSCLDSCFSHSDSGLILLGGRPDTGRTSFLLSVINNMISDDTRSVILYFTRRKDPDSLYERFISIASKVPIHKIAWKELSADDKIKIDKAISKVTWIFFLVDDSPKTEKEIMDEIQCAYEVNDRIDLVIIDELNSILPDFYDDTVFDDVNVSNQLNYNAEEMLSSHSNYFVNICRKLRNDALRKRYQIVCTLTTTDTTGIVDHVPKLANTRNYGMICDIADIILLLHRETFYYDNEEDHTMEVIIAKNENGRNGTVSLKYDTKTTGLLETDRKQEWFEENDEFF